MFAVARLNAPSDIGLAPLQHRLDLAAHIYVDEGPIFAAHRGAGPEALAIGGPIDRGNADPFVQADFPFGAAVRGNQANFRIERYAPILAESDRFAVGR